LVALVEPKCQQAKRWWKFYDVCETALVTKAKNNKLPKEVLAKIQLAKKKNDAAAAAAAAEEAKEKTQSTCSNVADNVHYSINSTGQTDQTFHQTFVSLDKQIRKVQSKNTKVSQVNNSNVNSRSLFFSRLDQHMLSTSEFDSSKLFEKRAILLSSQRETVDFDCSTSFALPCFLVVTWNQSFLISSPMIQLSSFPTLKNLLSANPACRGSIRFGELYYFLLMPLFANAQFSGSLSTSLFDMCSWTYRVFMSSQFAICPRLKKLLMN
ncbi:hypothetical protein TYRP_011883, partial [Tyrophagus putrescentiae]